MEAEAGKYLGGNPAEFIKNRFDEEVIKLPLEVQWRNWDIKEITKSIPILTSDDI